MCALGRGIASSGYAGSRHGKAGLAGSGGEQYVRARSCKAGCGKAKLARLSGAGPIMVRCCRPLLVRVERGMARQAGYSSARCGSVGLGKACSGKAGRVWLCQVRFGAVLRVLVRHSCGMARQAKDLGSNIPGSFCFSVIKTGTNLGCQR
jgi:hypothetical protein